MSLPKFECYSDPAALGLRWTRWLASFELFADGKGLILLDDVEPAIRQRRRAILLHHADANVQDIFSTLPNTGQADDNTAVETALTGYFVPQVNTAFACQAFYQTAQKDGEMMQQFVTRLRQAAKDCAFEAGQSNTGCSAQQMHV